MLTEKLLQFMLTAKQTPDPFLYKTLVYEEFGEWRDAENGTDEDAKEAADLIVVLSGYLIAQGYDPTKVFKEVMENNIGRMVQDDGTVQFRQDGKVLKNPNYPKVDLSNAKFSTRLP